MPRIIGVDIPENKKILFSLQFIYGVGGTVAETVLREAQVDPDKRAKDLTNEEVNRIQRIFDRYELEGDLRRHVSDNIDRLKRIRSYRGMRHIMKLPARGQRTRTNSRNARGGSKRKTVGAMSKEMATKLETAKKGK
ncbi:MAG: 30S ribosomal protein S13 [Candidatus Pacebacteria bacterium CG_4_10_14_3_um_filter_34_15]|nr:30S ribosomal protein S13 [Candidatus Pacearchaeota archaeon]NCQ65270.1 30S ribosomal protein S13 [Candidatus Paceibacterota bacterium]OIO45005.1 MAG: 30S ribosomal protein S13 [Candidatus Pacebacteria bacterium CG1_02_43_31]PIQ81049.1 MAG: 30S ribosomal protein S13 [Candidatus Pacebacteria bacterium CG11_big_fil_rev_8_21_14_0_20_34_55]PIX81866.1 MAG: 30S ribosomal protein S13 [Candidatus Pacebacteria bacterium CG_4_10_14_3_um_filter_34_15]PJC44081.1 MAG: 30S ribosomal protein S13 [Candidat